jgi:serine/threonine-protein kinase
MDAPARILVIEDEEVIRTLIEELLSEQGYEVLTASNGADGVRKTFSEVPDVVMTDIKMPDMDGLAYIKRIRSKIPPSSLPIIVVSSMSMEDTIDEAFALGATDYLLKPFRNPELLMRVQVALRVRIDLPPADAEAGGPEGVRGHGIEAGSVLDMGKYRIVTEINWGGMGAIYLARHRGFGIDVALKVLDPELAGQRDHVMRFLREVRIATLMDHPHIVRVFDVGFSGEHYYYAMENLPNCSLLDRIDTQGPLSEPEALEVGVQMASALDHMHGKGVMHRDLKPGNILVTAPGEYKLIDFGLAAALDDDRLTKPGFLMGTAGFVAPEVILNQRPGPLVDIYGLGATLYTLVTGNTPFGDRVVAEEILRAQTAENPTAVHEIQPLVSHGFSGVVHKMMERDPKKRYRFMRQAQEDLQRLRRI